MIHLAVRHFNRSSGGGFLVNSEFTDALRASEQCVLSTFDGLRDVNPAADATICMGTEAFKKPGIPCIVWPLTVAPLDREAIKLGCTSISFTVRYRLLKFKVWRSLRKAEALVFDSHYARDLHRSHFPWLNKLPTLAMDPGVVPPKALQTGERATAIPGRIVMVSHLYPYKMILQAIEAFHLVMEKVPHAELLIVGRETDPTYAKQIRAAIGDEKRIQMNGFVPPEDLAKIYTSAEVVLFNSICENAGSFTAFDAVWLGCAMVCSDKSSMPEAMLEGVRYANPWQPEETAKALIEALTDSQYLATLQQKARDRGASLQTWSERAQQVIEFCNSLKGGMRIKQN